jgi:Hint domain
VVAAGTNTVVVGSFGTGLASVDGTLDAGVLTIGGGGTGTVTVTGNGLVGLSGGMTIGGAGVLTLSNGLMNIAGLSRNAGQIDGFGLFDGGLGNTGTVAALGGELSFDGTLAGTGVDQIGGGATLEVDGGIDPGQSITFQASTTAAALVLGSLNSTVQGFGLANWQNGDELVLFGAEGETVTGAHYLGSGTLAVTTSVNTYDFTGVSLAAGTTPIFDTGAHFVELVSCFAAGTLIETARGPVAVEALREGDLLPTLIAGELAPVVWIGWRTIDCAAHPDPSSVWPVRVAAGAFGAGAPVRDLWLSPDHAVYLNGVLVPVKHLINGGSIAREARVRVTYFHVELPAHDVIRAEGLPVETYLDVGDRDRFRTWEGAVRPRRDPALVWEAAGAAPLVVTGPALAAARAAYRTARDVPGENQSFRWPV